MPDSFSLYIYTVMESETATINKAKGCIVGAFCGDALGAPAEFTTKPLTNKELEKIMEMNSSGKFSIQPGQITDDSEMAMCILHGLLECPKNKFYSSKILNQYSMWLNSPPFDIGITIEGALARLSFISPSETSQFRKMVYENVQNRSSQSNGSLMRISPLAVYLSKITNRDLISDVVSTEVGLTHSNDIIHMASISYCLAIKELINGKDRKEAYNQTKQWIMTSTKCKTSKNFKEFITWFDMIDKNIEMPGIEKSGWAKIPFVNGFQYLLNGMNYNDSVKRIIGLGGDTDTTAAIVGGLIGAADGFDSIPEYIREKMLSVDSQKGVIKRPDFLSPLKSNLLLMIEQLFDNRPDDGLTIFN